MQAVTLAVMDHEEEDNIMNVVNAIAPIAISDLKLYFVDKSTFYLIDYTNSTLKGTKLLTYLGNLDIPCDIKFSGLHDALELLPDYLNSTTLVNIPSLEFTAIDILLVYKGVRVNSKYEEFIIANKQIIDSWANRLDSLLLYNMHLVNVPEFEEFINEFPVDDTDDVVGVNFVSLLKHEMFYQYYLKLDKTSMKNYTRYFNDYMFKGKNMYSFWCNKSNPFFLLTYGIAENLFKPSEYTEALSMSFKEISNAASI